jgi:hypothetical protein
MPNRPCKPDADLKRIWQALLPGVAMPACGLKRTSGAATPEKSTSTKTVRDGSKPPQKNAK